MVAGALDLAATQGLVLTRGAVRQNVFWQVSGALTIGAGASLQGGDPVGNINCTRGWCNGNKQIAGTNCGHIE